MKVFLGLLLASVCLWAGTSAAQLVIVTPPKLVVARGKKVQLQAYLYQHAGVARLVTNTSTWTSLQPAIATVTSTGLVTMRGTGSAMIVATYNGAPGYGTVWGKTTPFINVPPSNASFGKIQHIVFIVKENRSFDQYFGTFPGANGTTTAKLHTGQIIPWGILPTNRSMTWATNGPIAIVMSTAAEWTGLTWNSNAPSTEITCA